MVLRRNLTLVLIASVGVGGIGPSPGEYSFAETLSAKQEAILDSLIQDLETLRSDPDALKRIEGQVTREKAVTESQLQSLDQEIKNLEASIAEFEKLQNRLLNQKKPGRSGEIPIDESQPQIAAAAASPSGGHQWWAFQPLRRPAPPAAPGDNWSSNPIDQFVYARLESNDMRPAASASRFQLVRRLYFDLIGLPPTHEELDAFFHDSSPDPWGNLVDRLLADPRYGEHWARFWLDLVRYAESDGWKKDGYRPHIWRYRDYVVNAFNNDKPYPRFVREQLAGDEIPGDDPEHTVAAGFLRLGIYEYNQRDAKSHWDGILNEITDVAGDVFLGLSISCSRCHNHKFDPIPQSDYFGLRAFFEPLIWKDDVPAVTKAEEEAWRTKLERWEKATAEIRAEIDNLRRPYMDQKRSARIDTFPLEIQACFNKPIEQRTSWEHQMAYLVERQARDQEELALESLTEEHKEQLALLEERLAEFDNLKPKPLPVVMSVADFPGPRSPTIIPTDRSKTPVGARFLTALSGNRGVSETRDPGIPESAGRRSALAEWIGNGDNPLTTRVIVNRIWQQHFGRGIVPTSNEFGQLGKPPTHPDLLDWLTVTFIENGWSMKRLHKLILMSSTWRQSSNHPKAEEYLAEDPSESLLWRARARRLKAEEIRDSMLMATGELNDRIGGPSVKAEVPRRALYVQRFRNSPDEMLHLFDAANGLSSVAQCTVTTTPLQALFLFNGDYTLNRAMKLAARIRDLDCETPEQALLEVFLSVWGRRPTKVELEKAVSFVSPAAESTSSGLDHEKLVDFCHVLFNSNEFLYVD